MFTVLAALSGMEREYIRDRTLEGHEPARARGKAIGGAAWQTAALGYFHDLRMAATHHLTSLTTQATPCLALTSQLPCPW